MQELQILIEDLNAITPLGSIFPELLVTLIAEQTYYVSKTLIELNQEVNELWYIRTGYVIGEESDSADSWKVVKIAGGRTIVTCLPAFFGGSLSDFRLTTVGEVRLYQVSKSSFTKLSDCPETEKIVNHLMLAEITDQKRLARLVSKPEDERVAGFLELTGFYDLPAIYAASYLNMSEDSYLQHKLRISNKLPGWNPKLSAGTQQRKHELTKTLMHQIRHYILENYTDHDIGSTADIAKKFFITRQTLYREFQKSFGTTVMAMIRDERMKSAKYMLRQQQTNITQVAAALGFRDLYAFSAAFKKYFGISPRKFINL